ncbi:MAG: histidine phosphatase family protein [Parvularculaceae bacterium]|nr:histidine phosphatase family protein [Parvularculaceae bacterium]
MRGLIDIVRMPGGRVRLKHDVWFLRHGETDWNRERRYQGHTDIPLNARGREQAARNGAALKDATRGARGVAFIASPLVRCTETLIIARAAMGLPQRRYGIDDRLIEIDLGAWNGKTYDEVAEDDPGVHERRGAYKWDFRIPEGETYREAAARVRDFLTDLRSPAVIVGHGATGRLLRGYVTGAPLHRVPHLAMPQDVVFHIRGGREREL